MAQTVSVIVGAGESGALGRTPQRRQPPSQASPAGEHHRAFGRPAARAEDGAPGRCQPPGGEAKITLVGPNGLVLDWVRGIATADMRRIMAEVQRERGRLIEAWKDVHG